MNSASDVVYNNHHGSCIITNYILEIDLNSSLIETYTWNQKKRFGASELGIVEGGRFFLGIIPFILF